MINPKHPLLRSALEKLPPTEMPEPISDIAEMCLELKCADVPLNKIHTYLDDFAKAVLEAVEVQLAATTLAGKIQAEMRLIERSIRENADPGEKTTQLERKMKTSENWILMEQELSNMKALVTYCEQIIRILNNKEYALRLRLKEDLA